MTTMQLLVDNGDGTYSTVTARGDAQGRLLLGAPSVQMGAGVITGTTQRVTLASDGPGIASLQSIDLKLGATLGALVQSTAPLLVKAAIATGTLSTGVAFETRTCSVLVMGGYDIDVQWRRSTDPAGYWMNLSAVAFISVTGITDANQVTVRRKDVAATAVDLYADALRRG